MSAHKDFLIGVVVAIAVNVAALAVAARCLTTYLSLPVGLASDGPATFLIVTLADEMDEAAAAVPVTDRIPAPQVLPDLPVAQTDEEVTPPMVAEPPRDPAPLKVDHRAPQPAAVAIRDAPVTAPVPGAVPATGIPVAPFGAGGSTDSVAVASSVASETTADAGEGAGLAPVDPIQPRYPRDARREGREGLVVVHANVGKDGRVVKVEVCDSSGTPSLDRAAVEAVRKARFKPVHPDRLASDGDTTLRIRFQLVD